MGTREHPPAATFTRKGTTRMSVDSDWHPCLRVNGYKSKREAQRSADALTKLRPEYETKVARISYLRPKYLVLRRIKK